MSCNSIRILVDKCTSLPYGHNIQLIQFIKVVFPKDNLINYVL